jgi:hypothetical protein
MMAEIESENDEKIWKKFLRKHWKMTSFFVIAASIAFIGVILVFLWFVGEAQLTNLIPTTLDLWTMGHFITFLLYLIFWEILLIGIPVLIVIGAIFYLWWKKLPDEEKNEYKDKHLFGKRSRRTEGGEGISFLIFIAFVIKIYLDGNWDTPFATWTFDYLIYSCITAFIWIIIIFGIPILIGVTLWLRYEIKKKP